MLTQQQVDQFCWKVACHLRREREQQGLSMTAVAERAGLSQNMVSYVERGMRKPTLDTVVRMSLALQIDLADVIRKADSGARASRGRRPPLPKTGS